MNLTSFDKYLINLGLSTVKSECTEAIDRHKYSTDSQSKGIVQGNQKTIADIEELQKKLDEK